MNNDEFEQFVLEYGRDVLRFCRITAGSDESGDELYQDTMLKLAEKRNSLDSDQNTKSYALSTAILLWKNRRRKYALRNRLIRMESMDALEENGWQYEHGESGESPEDVLLSQNEMAEVQKVVAGLPEKYRLPIHLFYAADMQISAIAKLLRVPEGTVKSRLRKAKKLLKEELEALGYDR